MSEVAEEYLSRKGQTLDDYLEYIKQPGNKGDKLVLSIMACMANISTIVVTKTGVWSTFDGDVSDAELVLVYLRKSMFQDMVPIPTKPKPEPPHKDVYKHEDAGKNPNRCITRSMGDGKTTLPSPLPLPTESEPVSSKCRGKHHKRKLRIKIVKERQYKIRRWQCMTRKCSLCKIKFKSTKELNDHITNRHEYEFLCKYHKCCKSYNSKLSADHHIRHHSSGSYQCDKCSKMFHEKYILEAHLNTHMDHGYQCTYPKCDRVYKSQAEYNHHLLTHTQLKDEVSCPICDKVFDLKKYLDEHLKRHSEDLPEECPHCGNRFWWHSSLGIYIRLRHPDWPPPPKKNNNLHICCVQTCSVRTLHVCTCINFFLIQFFHLCTTMLCMTKLAWPYTAWPYTNLFFF